MALQMWHCTLCGSAYKEKDKASICETQHMKVADLKIEKVFFEPRYLNMAFPGGAGEIMESMFGNKLTIPSKVELRYGKGEGATALYKKE